MIKITQPHLSMNNMFPPINTHSRGASEELHGVSSGGLADIHTASKQQQIQRHQQTIDQQRRSPLRIIYRASDYAWQDHPNKTSSPNQPVRAASPLKNKITTSARHLANGVLHETTANSMAQLPTSSSSIVQQQQDINHGHMQLSSSTKTRLPTTRIQRTNSHLDKNPVAGSYGLPIRSESYRSSRLDYGLRQRHPSSKQRNYVTSKTSFHDINTGELLNQDENTYHQQTQQIMSSTQRLNVSSFDLATSRKVVSPSKSNSFNMNGHQNFFNSTQELHRTGTMLDRNNLARFIPRETTSKEQVLTAPKQQHQQTSTRPTGTVTTNIPAVVVQTNDRDPSANSYKSRDPNLSYAYTDVKKYIEENDLMSPEKEQSIKSWIIDVEKNRHQLQKIE